MQLRHNWNFWEIVKACLPVSHRLRRKKPMCISCFRCCKLASSKLPYDTITPRYLVRCWSGTKTGSAPGTSMQSFSPCLSLRTQLRRRSLEELPDIAKIATDFSVLIIMSRDLNVANKTPNAFRINSKSSIVRNVPQTWQSSA